jgi:hypothetical protein|uniref:Uncharacterized protein n=1 Tax=viral metagenome TaxID=1070528 RepID=A0A6C0B6G8_9ZZZZ
MTTPAPTNLPPATVLLRAAQISVDEDRPILLDYWTDSRDKKCCIGVKDNAKYLVKNESEYTSTVQNIFRIDGCFIVLTENSLYIVSQEIPVRKIVSELKGE